MMSDHDDDHRLDPGQRGRFFVLVPDHVTPEQLAAAKVRVRFRCGRCGRRYQASVLLTGGLIAVDCSCGAELRLEMGVRG